MRMCDRAPPSRPLIQLVLAAALAAPLSGARANTINQNTSWTITRPGAAQTYRVVAYGDSLFAGYNGALFSVAKRAGPYVDGEYLSKNWGTNVQVIRRAKSGATADDIFFNKIIAERGYMQHPSTRVVLFEMCGNDYLQARSNFNGQTGTCDLSAVENALTNCTRYMELAMQEINTHATTAKLKLVANLYYPGYDADNSLSRCTDAATGAPVNKQDLFLGYLARSNWRACSLARKYGFACADTFAQFMGADYDSNGDGRVDSTALEFNPRESESSYVSRISITLRSTVRDSNLHLVSSSASYDYLLSDNVHPTYYGGTIGLGLFTGSGSGAGPSDFSDAEILNGKNPEWNKWGHERIGWSMSTSGPSSP
jgi:lysophospholipase L1-like esterase